MKSIQKYLKKKAADGTVYKAAGAIFVLFNFLYLILPISSHLVGKKSGLNFFKDAADPRTYFYIITSSIISAVLISSFIFHKIKTKQLKYNDEGSFYDKIKGLLDINSKGEVEKITINLDHNGLMIMPGKNVIEIPVLHYDTADQELKETNKPFEGVTFTAPSFWSSKNKSIYLEVIGSEEVCNTIGRINGSKIFFFKKTDHDKYHNSGSYNVRYQYDTAYLSDKKTQKPADEIFNFTDLYNISSIKLHYTDCSSTEVELKLKEEPAADMDKYNELLDYVNANRPHSLSNIKEPQVAFVPAIAGNRPIFYGEVL